MTLQELIASKQERLRGLDAEADEIRRELRDARASLALVARSNCGPVGVANGATAHIMRLAAQSTTFTHRDVVSIAGAHNGAALLSGLIERGRLVRVSRGVYALATRELEAVPS